MDIKTCTVCKQQLSLSEFNWRNKIKGTLQAQCKSCQRECQNRYYKHNPAFQENVKRAARKRKINVKIRFLEYLKQQSCMDCGIRNPIVLTHDHRDPKLKTECVSIMIARSYGWSAIETEIAKCDVVCFNCHAIRTAKTQKWYENWK